MGDFLKSLNGVVLDPWGKQILAVWCAMMVVLGAGLAYAVVRDTGGLSDTSQAYDVAAPDLRR
jgi:hypothetical protein